MRTHTTVIALNVCLTTEMWQIRFKVTVVETTNHPSFCVGCLCIYQCLYLSVCVPLMQLRLFDVKGFGKETFFFNYCFRRIGGMVKDSNVCNKKHLLTYLLTYLLHGAESFLRSYPVNFAASQEIPRIYGTGKFLTVHTSARHPSLS